MVLQDHEPELIEKMPTLLAFDVAVGMFLQNEITSSGDFSGSHNALAAHTRPPAPNPSSGGAPGSNTKLPCVGSSGGKLGSPSPNQGNNNRRRFTNNGGYQGTANSRIHGQGTSMPTPSRSLLCHARLQRMPTPHTHRSTTGGTVRPLCARLRWGAIWTVVVPACTPDTAAAPLHACT